MSNYFLSVTVTDVLCQKCEFLLKNKLNLKIISLFRKLRKMFKTLLNKLKPGQLSCGLHTTARLDEVQLLTRLRVVDNSEIGKRAMAEGKPPKVICVYNKKRKYSLRITFFILNRHHPLIFPYNFFRAL